MGIETDKWTCRQADRWERVMRAEKREERERGGREGGRERT